MDIELEEIPQRERHVVSIPRSFLNLMETEFCRPRGDGLSTKLVELAKEMDYKFVYFSPQDKFMENAGVSGLLGDRNDFRGMHVGLIWDHYAVHMACSNMLRAFQKLEKLYETLRNETDALERNYQFILQDNMKLNEKLNKARNLLS